MLSGFQRRSCFFRRQKRLGAFAPPPVRLTTSPSSVSTCARYSKEERQTLRSTLQKDQLQLQEDRLRHLGPDVLAQRLQVLGEDVQPSHSTWLLRRRLAQHYLQLRSQVVAFPLRRIPHGNHRASKSYFVLPIDVEDLGFVDFVIDTGSSGCLITGELRDQLGIQPASGGVVRGLDNTGLTLRQKVALPQLSLGSKQLDIRDGYVTSIKVDPKGDVGGVLGLKFLSSFEVELDPETNSIAFHPIGHIEQGGLDVQGMSRLTCSLLKGGLLQVPASLNGSDTFPAILDLAANFSTINWPAAALAGFGRQSPQASSSPAAAAGMEDTVQVRGSNGQNTMIKKGAVSITLGDPNLHEEYQPSEQSSLLIRDAPSFATLGFADSPAMILGRDVICRSRTVLALGSNTMWLQA